MTPKQAKFVEEYLKDHNATQAAIRAGYSAKTAEVQGPRLLGNVRVKAAIAEHQKEGRKRTEITVDSLSEKMLKVFKGASDSNQWGAAQQALMGLGKLHGLIIDRKNVTVFDKPYSQWSIEEKIAVRDALREHNGSTDSVH